MSINLTAQLKKLEKSPKFQKMVAEARKDAAKRGASFGQGSGAFSPALAKKKAERMRELLFEETIKVIPSISIHGIEIGNVETDANGNFVVNVGFNRYAAWRGSLYGVKYDGIENIFLHFTHGWDAKGYAYGEWHGDAVRSRAHYDGNDFIQRAVDRFNAEMQGSAAVDIDPIYL